LPSPTYALPSSLKAVELKDISINQLTTIVYHCLWLLKQNQRLPSSKNALKKSRESLGLSIIDKKQPIPTSISLSELIELLPIQVSRTLVNINNACRSLLSPIAEMPGNLFHPDNNDFHLKWMSAGAQYSNGRQLTAINYRKHPTSDQRFLKDKAIHCMSCIVFHF
jgi:hypothetical protein